MNNNRPKKAYTVIIASIILLVIIGIASYSFFNVGNLNVSNVVNLNVATEDNNMVFDTIGGEISLNVTIDNMLEGSAGTLAAQNNTTLNVTFQANTPYSVVCSYDIVWEWTSVNRYEEHSTGVIEEEITIQATLSGSGGPGINYISNEQDIADLIGNQDSEVVVSQAEIDSTGNSTNTAVWNLYTRFYNVDVDQTALAGKNYTGRFKVANVNCRKGTAKKTLATFIEYEAPKSGTDAVSNRPWILTEDHPNEWRYAGKNPDNYIQFNGELWRIIGLMPNMTYCTGVFGTETECNTTQTGSLVKIIRNQTISSSTMYWDYKQTGVGSSISINGSNDWSDSQLMLMLNGTNYLKTGYDVNNTKLHNSYTITSNIVAGNGYNFYNATYSYLDGNGQTVYKPRSATTSSYTEASETLYKKIESSALSQIATVKWDLYGISSYSTAEGSPSAFYNKERNINGLGSVYTDASLPENRAVYWYGKIGLMYPSDYGYATNGGTTYDRNTCLGYQMSGWNSGSYKIDCAGNSYLWYDNITSTALLGTSGTDQWTLSPFTGYSNRVFYVGVNGEAHYEVTNNTPRGVRPVLYLKADTLIGGGSGTWNDPYTIDPVDSTESKSYWFPSNIGVYTFPASGGTVQTSGPETGHNVYIGQDSSKYYVCATISGREICLSQPYTQYGLDGHASGDYFTNDEQESGKRALYRMLLGAGVDVNLSDCESHIVSIRCSVGNISYELNFSGSIDIRSNGDNYICYIDNNMAECQVIWGGGNQ